MTTKKEAPKTAATVNSAELKVHNQDITKKVESQFQDKRLDFWPSVWETMQAEKVFRESLTAHEKKTRCSLGRINPEMAVKLAIIDVWRAARRFQAGGGKPNG